MASWSLHEQGVCNSAFFLAEISVRSPRKLLNFIMFKKKLDQSIRKTFYIILKTEALVCKSALGSIIAYCMAM